MKVTSTSHMGAFANYAVSSWVIAVFCFFSFPFSLLRPRSPNGFLGIVTGVGFALTFWGAFCLIFANVAKNAELIALYSISIILGLGLTIEGLRARKLQADAVSKPLAAAQA